MTNSETIGIIMFVLFIFFLLSGIIFLKYDAGRNEQEEKERKAREEQLKQEQEERVKEKERRRLEEEERRHKEMMKQEILDKIYEVTKR